MKKAPSLTIATKSIRGFILPLLFLVIVVVFWLILAFNWQNIARLTSINYSEQNLLIEDIAQRQFALILDELNSTKFQNINAKNYGNIFKNKGMYIDAKIKTIRAGIKGVKNCNRDYNSNLANNAVLDINATGCVQVAIVFPNKNREEFFLVISMQIKHTTMGIKKFYQGIAYNFSDARYTSLPVWLDNNANILGQSQIEYGYITECDYFKSKIPDDNPCR